MHFYCAAVEDADEADLAPWLGRAEPVRVAGPEAKPTRRTGWSDNTVTHVLRRLVKEGTTQPRRLAEEALRTIKEGQVSRAPLTLHVLLTLVKQAALPCYGGLTYKDIKQRYAPDYVSLDDIEAMARAMGVPIPKLPGSARGPQGPRKTRGRTKRSDIDWSDPAQRSRYSKEWRKTHPRRQGGR